MEELVHRKKQIICLLCAGILLIGLFPACAKGAATIGFNSVLMGAFLDGKWVSASDLQGKEEYRLNRIWGGHDCRVYSSKGLEGDGTISAIHREHPDCGEFHIELDAPIFDVTMENGQTLSFGSARLALISSWNPIPRRATPIGIKNAAYNKAVKEYLGRNGLPDAEPNIMQIFRVDLEGDGQDEVIIYAQNIIDNVVEATTWEMDKPLSVGANFPEGTKKGNYSVLLLRKIVGGKVREIPLSQFLDLKDGKPPSLHKIYQFADLNGDGVMEIIVGEYSCEGVSYIVYEIKGDKAVEALREFVPTGRHQESGISDGKPVLIQSQSEDRKFYSEPDATKFAAIEDFLWDHSLYADPAPIVNETENSQWYKVIYCWLHGDSMLRQVNKMTEFNKNFVYVRVSDVRTQPAEEHINSQIDWLMAGRPPRHRVGERLNFDEEHIKNSMTIVLTAHATLLEEPREGARTIAVPKGLELLGPLYATEDSFPNIYANMEEENWALIVDFKTRTVLGWIKYEKLFEISEWIAPDNSN